MVRSVDEARRAFDAYARLDPRLAPLWEQCELAAPPTREPELVDDVYDADPFELDDSDKPDDGWCAEDYFLHHVKSQLMLLVGVYRPGASHQLHSSEAYDTVYDLLLHWALARPCACCAEYAEHERRAHV